MQLARKIYIFAFVCVIFTGTVGINVFAHFCQLDGVDYSYVVPPDHACQKEVKEASCCHAKQVKAKPASEISSNCCKEEVSSFKITSEYIQKSVPGFSMEFIPVQATTCVYRTELYRESGPCVLSYTTRPPPKTGREILVLHQVFRI